MIAMWFGCDGGTSSGHRYHPSKVGDEWSSKISPWGDHIDNGSMYPGGEGVARLHHLSGWTCLQFEDRTGDRRGGSHTAFLFDQELDFETALSTAQQRWPQLFERFTFEVIDETPS